MSNVVRSALRPTPSLVAVLALFASVLVPLAVAPPAQGPGGSGLRKAASGVATTAQRRQA